MSDQVLAADAAFDRAEKEIRDLGQAVVERITIEYRARRIDKRGVQQRVTMAISQLRSLPADDVPESMCRLLEQTLRETIAKALIAAGIPLGGLPA
jgi:hypothetical protein